MEITIRTRQREYPILLERGAIDRIPELIGGSERVFIISETGVPVKWKDKVSCALGGAPLYEFGQGEEHKNLNTYSGILSWLAENRASRKDLIVALGGGVTGDLAGFAAATYMRGIRYINIPTTLLSQLDSSIGGKTAVDHAGIKNIAGAFWQPSAVIIDPDTLQTLPERQIRNGLAEAVKAGMIRDCELLGIFEDDDYMDRIDEIILRSLMVKKEIVEEDENENSVRKLLNFGHTWGHAYESLATGEYLHGECVAMGMMTVLRGEEIRGRLAAILDRLDLPSECKADPEAVCRLILNDKKTHGDLTDVVQVDEIGNAHIETWSIEDVRRVSGK